MVVLDIIEHTPIFCRFDCIYKKYVLYSAKNIVSDRDEADLYFKSVLTSDKTKY